MSIILPSHVSKEEFLLKLWKSTKALGMGYLHPGAPTISDCNTHFAKSEHVDYLVGRPIKVDFSKHPIFDPSSYDQNAGEGMMQKVVNSFSEGDSNLDIKEENDVLTHEQMKDIVRECDKSIILH
jgi:hypothetical protein